MRNPGPDARNSTLTNRIRPLQSLSPRTTTLRGCGPSSRQSNSRLGALWGAQGAVDSQPCRGAGAPATNGQPGSTCLELGFFQVSRVNLWGRHCHRPTQKLHLHSDNPTSAPMGQAHSCLCCFTDPVPSSTMASCQSQPQIFLKLSSSSPTEPLPKLIQWFSVLQHKFYLEPWLAGRAASCSFITTSACVDSPNTVQVDISQALVWGRKLSCEKQTWAFDWLPPTQDPWTVQRILIKE